MLTMNSYNNNNNNKVFLNPDIKQEKEALCDMDFIKEEVDVFNADIKQENEALYDMDFIKEDVDVFGCGAPTPDYEGSIEIKVEAEEIKYKNILMEQCVLFEEDYLHCDFECKSVSEDYEGIDVTLEEFTSIDFGVFETNCCGQLRNGSQDYLRPTRTNSLGKAPLELDKMEVHTDVRESFRDLHCEKINPPSQCVDVIPLIDKEKYLLENITMSSEREKEFLLVKKFTCNLCQKVFSQKLGLISHLKTHLIGNARNFDSYEKPYNSNFQKGNLKIRMWQGQAQYYNKTAFGCKSCDKRFARIEYWNDHLKNHISETPVIYEEATLSRGIKEELNYIETINEDADFYERIIGVQDFKIEQPDISEECEEIDVVKEEFPPFEDAILDEGEESDLSDQPADVLQDNSVPSSSSLKTTQDVGRKEVHIDIRMGFSAHSEKVNVRPCISSVETSQKMEENDDNGEVIEISRAAPEKVLRSLNYSEEPRNYLSNKKSVENSDTDGLEYEFKCDICHKRLKSKFSLIRHKRRIHGLKTFICDICQEAFARITSYIRHLRIHYGKSFHCQICQKSFCYRKRFYAHLKTHKRKNPYICNLCPASFNVKKKFEIHLLRHTFEKQFQDRFGDKQFSRKYNLQTPIKIRMNSDEVTEIIEEEDVYIVNEGVHHSDHNRMSQEQNRSENGPLSSTISDEVQESELMVVQKPECHMEILWDKAIYL